MFLKLLRTGLRDIMGKVWFGQNILWESVVMDYQEWNSLSYTMKNHQLYLSQKETLRKLRDRNAISEDQYNKSLHDLTVKMKEA